MLNDCTHKPLDYIFLALDVYCQYLVQPLAPPFCVFIYPDYCVILPIYTIYSSFFAKNSPSLKEAELNQKIDEILKKTESKAVIEKREALEKQQAIWDAEIQQFTDENNERQETLACINQEIAVLTSYIIPFLPKKKLNK